jgi:gluconate 5-dehydrogenase
MDKSNRTSLFDLTGSRALITGSSRGIGFALAKGLAEAGAAIVLNGRDRDKLERAAGELRKEGFTIATAVFDVTERDAVESAIGKIESEIGVIDILVNNVGIQHRAPLEDFPADAWERLININLSSVFHVSQAVAKYMIPRMTGKIINICSVQSQLSRPTIAPYAATKGGVAMLTKGMCVDWAKYGIQINGIAPGYFATEMNKALVENKEFSDWLCKRTPSGRWGNVDELCGTAVFLASKASTFVNGQIIYVDGGLTSSL